MDASKKFLMEEAKRMAVEAPIGISASPIDDDLFVWRGTVMGPEGSYYEGGVYKLVIVCPENYPNEPPEIKFEDTVFHPNVTYDGLVCINILEARNWKPMTIEALLLSVQMLLSDPNPEEPADFEAANLLEENPVEFRNRVQQIIAYQKQNIKK